jgi:hypothetical protein
MVRRRSPLLTMLGLVLGCSSETLATDEELDATAPAHPAPAADGGLVDASSVFTLGKRKVRDARAMVARRPVARRLHR